MSDTNYNGWTNYETWNLALWIDNEQGSSEYWRDRARECYETALSLDADNARGAAYPELADQLKSETEDNAPEVQGFYADILSAAISEVNWYEIAEHYVNEVADDIDEDRKADDDSDDAA